MGIYVCEDGSRYSPSEYAARTDVQATKKCNYVENEGYLTQLPPQNQQNDPCTAGKETNVPFEYIEIVNGRVTRTTRSIPAFVFSTIFGSCEQIARSCADKLHLQTRVVDDLIGQTCYAVKPDAPR